MSSTAKSGFGYDLCHCKSMTCATRASLFTSFMSSTAKGGFGCYLCLLDYYYLELYFTFLILIKYFYYYCNMLGQIFQP
jgi:hypothetical protein